MPFEIVRNDITYLSVDAIVNTANLRPVIGGGVDAAIHKAAGPRLLRARQKIGDISVGHAAITPAFRLDAKYVIHTVGPVWQGGDNGEEALLRQCYEASLKLAAAKHCRSIAFPLISTGYHGLPKDRALQIAISAFRDFLAQQEMQIYLVVYDRSSYRLSEQLLGGIESYIDDHYVREHTETYRSSYDRRASMPVCSAPCCAPPDRDDADFSCNSLEEMLMQEDAGFTETLLKLMEQKGKKPSEVYKKANLTKQHFSKIRNNPHYHPTKPTAIALALALELELKDIKDLISRAGYTLTNSSKFDLIILYHVEKGIYDVIEINCVLFDYDQSLLGA